MVFGSTRVPISRVLTFSYASRDTLLGSSHPDTPESGAPANLGLLVSRDGRTWLPRSLLGTADLHLIRPAEGTLYARDYAVPRLLITSNFGRNWTARKLPGEVIDLAVDPQKPSHAFAVTDRALLVTEDLARSWRPAGEATAVVWPTHGPLYVAGADGSVRASEKGEDEGDIRGVLDSPATELSAGRRGELWALSDDRVLRISRRTAAAHGTPAIACGRRTGSRSAWLLLVACSAVGIGWALRTPLFRAYYDHHHEWREAPREFLWTTINATLLGLGTGSSSGSPSWSS